MKHHAVRIRRIHTRYCLIAANALLLCGLLTYGFTVRNAQADTDTAVLHSMMDSDTDQPYILLTPPEIK